MNDRHLSRGKRFPCGEWIEGYYRETQGYDCETLHLIHCIQGQCEDYLIDPATIGRCTGLPDKNGKLIFEGDILRVRADEEEPETYRVAFENYSWEMRSPIYDYQELRDFVNDYTTLEIIGNVFDNPELLTQED